MVAAGRFRKWLARNGASGAVPWVPGTNTRLPLIERDRRKLFDVYHTHTKDCTHCSRAAARAVLLRNALGTGAAAAGAGALGAAAAGAALGSAGGTAAATTWPASIAAATAAAPSATSNMLLLAVLPPAGSFLSAAGGLLGMAAVLGALAVAVHNFQRMYYVLEMSHQDNK